MSRNVSELAIRAMFAQETEEVFLCRLEIAHEDWAEPYRFINDQVGHTDAAMGEWIGFPFKISLPDDREDEIPLAQLSIDNVDRSIVQAMREITTPAVMTLWVVLASDIDDVIAGPYEFSFNAASWDALTVSGSLEFEPILNMRWPEDTFNVITTPGLFKS